MEEMRKSYCVIVTNINKKVDSYKIKDRNNFQQTNYIILAENEENNNQGPILQPISGNIKRKKLKKKVKIH